MTVIRRYWSLAALMGGCLALMGLGYGVGRMDVYYAAYGTGVDVQRAHDQAAEAFAYKVPPGDVATLRYCDRLGGPSTFEVPDSRLCGVVYGPPS